MKTLHQLHHPRRHAFSLLEVLTTLAIIGILSTIGLASMRNSSHTFSLTSGENLAASLLQNARSLAILKNSTVRVLINHDTADRSRCLRGIGIAVSRNNAGTTEWIAAGKMENLPEAIFFNPSLSKGNGNGETVPVMNLDFPKNSFQTEGTGPEWYYFEIGPNGMTDKSNGALFVLSSGRINESGTLVPFPQNQMRGFVLRQMGTLTSFESSDQLSQ